MSLRGKLKQLKVFFLWFLKALLKPACLYLLEQERLLVFKLLLKHL